MTPGPTRRELLGAAAVTGVGLAGWGAVPGWARKRPAPLAAGGRFAEGVASGLPRRREATLWTRLSDLEGPARIEYEVARDPGFDRVVHRARVLAAPRGDHCVHPVVPREALRPGASYWYRFATAGAESPVGRFRTLPPSGSRQPVRIGFWTCQDFRVGHYGAHAGMAAEPDLDLVVCLGDYIYETGGTSSIEGRDDLTGANSDGAAATLSDYRQKYRLYRTDPRLRELHARHAMCFVWDDHEVANNYWREGQSAASTPGFAARRAAAYRAWFDHLPVRRMFAGTPRADQIYRSLGVGGLAELFFTDTRQYRDAQPCGDTPLSPCPDRGAPRTMLGARQKRWLGEAMRRSRAPWKVVVNGVMLSALDQPAPGFSKFLDTWDGYAAERADLVTHWRERVEGDVIVMTGDEHDNYAGYVTPSGRAGEAAGAVEFVVPSVTSDNTSELLGGSAAGAAASEENARGLNPHLSLVDQRRHGYCVLELEAAEARVSFRHVAAREDPGSPVSTTYRLRVPRGRPVVEPV